MRVLEFQHNPFADFIPGGSPTDRWSNPPTIKLGGAFYLVLFYWDLVEMTKRQPAETMETFKEYGVSGQAIVRDTDGEEFYARVILGTQVQLIPSGFRGPTFTPPTNQTKEERESDMIYLDRYKQHVIGVYADDPDTAQSVEASLTECRTFASVQAWLATFWDKKSLAVLIDEFFNSEEAHD